MIETYVSIAYQFTKAVLGFYQVIDSHKVHTVSDILNAAVNSQENIYLDHTHSATF